MKITANEKGTVIIALFMPKGDCSRISQIIVPTPPARMPHTPPAFVTFFAKSAQTSAGVTDAPYIE